MSDVTTGDARTATTVQELEKDPQGVVKRWTLELHMADKAEEDWRKEVGEVLDIYESEKASNQSKFNILYSNTETLAPAVFNSAPEPDVRRRFRDKDLIGRYASEIMERALSYEIDTDDYDNTCEDLVLDVLLAGRGLARVKYVPTTAPMDPETGAPMEQPEEAPEGEATQPEVIVDQSVPIEHVQWDDFRRGPGKRWADVPWIAFRHEMKRDELIDNFGEEIGRLCPLKEEDAEGTRSEEDKDKQVFKTAEVWEVWDKEQKRVLFICTKYKERPLKLEEDPMGLPGFFPIPRPVRAVHRSSCLTPIPPYRQYKGQAKELNEISVRIGKITKAIKVRGAYNAVSEEIRKVMAADDMEMVPITAQAETAQSGGLDKQIWLMPVDMLANTLMSLYQAREQIVQTIYQISGVSDVMRAQTDPNETLGAQELKAKWGSLRLDRIQRDVQRYVRDLMRLQADVIANKFEIDVLEQITQVQLPRQADKDQLMQQAQMIQQQLQAMSRIPPGMADPAMLANAQGMQQQLMQIQQDPMLQLPSWEDVMAVLQNDLQRTYRIDIETDSTVSATIERDMSEMRETIGAIAEFIATATPAVQAGALPMEAMKDICLSITRHAKMGRQVEDAIEQLQAPAPPPPEAPAATGPSPEEVQGMLKDMQAQIGEILKAVNSPKMLDAQAGPNGAVKGEIRSAA